MKRALGRVNIQPVAVHATTGAGGNSDWVSLEGYDGVIFAVVVKDGTNPDDTTFNVEEASDNAGTGRKVVKVRTWYRKQVGSGLSSAGAYSSVIGTASQVVVEGSNENAILVEVTADELDLAGGFKFVSLRQNGAGSADKTWSAVAYLHGARYATDPTEWLAVDA